LGPSHRPTKKWMVKTPTKNVHFGAFGSSDYTLHKDQKRKNRYLARHRKRENWTSSGIATAGFWSRWLLWNTPNLADAVRDIEKRFNIKIIIIKN